MCQTAINDNVHQHNSFERNKVIEWRETVRNSNTISHKKTNSYSKDNDYLKALKCHKPTSIGMFARDKPSVNKSARYSKGDDFNKSITKPITKPATRPTTNCTTNPEITYPNNDANNNLLFDTLSTLNTARPLTNNEVFKIIRAKEELCTFVVPELKKIKVTRPK